MFPVFILPPPAWVWLTKGNDVTDNIPSGFTTPEWQMMSQALNSFGVHPSTGLAEQEHPATERSAATAFTSRRAPAGRETPRYHGEPRPRACRTCDGGTAGDWLPTSSPPGSGSCGSLSLSKWPPACSHSGESHWCWQARLPPGDSRLPPCCPLQPGTRTQQMEDRELNTHFRSDHDF